VHDDDTNNNEWDNELENSFDSNPENAVHTSSVSSPSSSRSQGLFPNLSSLLPYFENCFTSTEEATVSSSSSLSLLSSSLSFSRVNEKGQKSRRIFTGHILSAVV
jgi:hypothetical protein